MLTKQEMVASLRALGIKEGDTVVVHSSFKSLGPVDGGAETVVAAFLEAVGAEGTVVFPTLCQKDFEHAYENWHLDAPSDIGYLTNYFRKLPDAKRSDQATHSIAAIGKVAPTATAAAPIIIISLFIFALTLGIVYYTAKTRVLEFH